MDVVNLDGDIVSWHLTGHIAKGRIAHKSSYHLLARGLLIDLFPTLQILEEVSIPLKRNETLYLDFYIPLSKLCIEVHGEQHYKFIPFYHGNIMSFLKAQKKDREKKEWCDNNNIRYIELPYNENQEQWINRINHE
jgi:hypothetical protein